MINIKKILAITILLLLSIVLIDTTKAFEIGLPQNDSENVKISKDNIIKDNLFAFGKFINIDGNIDGDLITAGNNLELSGNIKNNIFAAGNSITIKGIIGKDVFVGATNVYVEKDAIIEGDLIVGTNTLVVEGIVKGNIRAGAKSIKINSLVEKNVYLNVENLSIGAEAKINGDVIYTSAKEANIDPASLINGKIERKQVTVSNTKKNKIHSFVLSFFGTLIVGVVLLTLLTKKIDSLSENIKNKFWLNLLIGFVALIVTPFIALILLISLVGTPLALIIIALYAFLIYASKIFVGIYIGKLILKDKWHPLASMTLGVFLIYIVSILPFIGGLVSFIVILLGLGAGTFLISTKK